MSIQSKYRRLIPEELVSLEKEFIDFLVVNGVLPDEWDDMKRNSSEKSEDLISLFSDVILEGTLRQVTYLNFFDEGEVMTFHCLSEQLVLVGIKTKNDAVDLSTEDLLLAALKEQSDQLQVYTSSKHYRETRESEIFKMMESGGKISDGTLFKRLCLLL